MGVVVTHAEKVRHLEKALAAGEVSYTRLLAQLFDEAKAMAVELGEMQQAVVAKEVENVKLQDRLERAEQLVRDLDLKLQQMRRNVSFQKRLV